MDEVPEIPGLQIRSEIGRGGMARVYVAVQTALGRKVAVKLVRPRSEADFVHLQRLENEAHALAGLQHPHIVELYDFGRTADGGMYYVMPLLPGGDLRGWGAPVAEERVIELLEALLDALTHAHAAGIVHRDIKPENILFDRTGRPLLADFGAALRRSRSRLTDEGLAIGSTGYMSPEQARGVEVDARADLYSLAVVAYELLTGCLPFEGPDALAIAVAQIENPVPRLPEALRHWQSFFDRALAAEPAWRFASAEAMRAALEEVAEAAERPAPMPPRSLRWLGWGLGGAALLVLAALLALTRDPAADLDRIGGLIGTGQLLPPAQPNALDAWLAARRQGVPVEELEGLRQRLLESLRAEQLEALAQGRLERLLPLWEQWQLAVGALGAHADPLVVAHNRQVEAALVPELERALRAFDRGEAALALRLVDASAMASKELLELASRVRALPDGAKPFADPGGPWLRLIEKPRGDRPGYALMAAPLDPELWSAHAPDSAPCKAPTEGVRGCIDAGQAADLAEWLSRRTGARYRLPHRGELAAGLDRLPRMPMYALTADCRRVQRSSGEGAFKRGLERVRGFFTGRRTQPAQSMPECSGQWALALDGSGQARAYTRPSPAVTVVLLREVPPAVGP